MMYCRMQYGYHVSYMSVPILLHEIQSQQPALHGRIFDFGQPADAGSRMSVEVESEPRSLLIHGTSPEDRLARFDALKP